MSIRHKQLHISSRDKNQGTNSNFTLCLSNHYWLQAVKSVVVKQVTITNVFYNLDSNKNTFTYNIASAPTTVTLAIGNYTVQELMTALNTAMVTAGVVGFVASLNPITEKIEFISTTAIEYLVTGNAMAETLGILSGSGVDVSSFTSAGFPRLQGPTNIAIQSSALGENNYLASDQKVQDIIVIVPVTTAFGGVLHYTTDHSDLDDWDSLSRRDGKNISYIDIRVVDKSTNILLDLQNHNIDIILKVYF